MLVQLIREKSKKQLDFGAECLYREREEMRVLQPAGKGHNTNQKVEVNHETNINRNLSSHPSSWWLFYGESSSDGQTLLSWRTCTTQPHSAFSTRGKPGDPEWQ